jgi:hypothetical protein
MVSRRERAMPHKVGLAIVCLHISAALYLVVGVLMFPLLMTDEDDAGSGLPLAVGLLILCLALIAGVELVVYGLHRRRFWAWIGGLCIFAIYVPSLFLPLGALGLWGLLDVGTRAEFGFGRNASSPRLSGDHAQ